MDADELRATIDAYKEQLQLIAHELSNASDSDRDGLITLQNDIKELIDVTEGQLLCVFKSDLFGELTTNDSKQSNGDSEASTSFVADQSITSNGDNSDIVGNLSDSVVGMRCQAPYGQGYGHAVCGGLKSHAAVILDIIDNQLYDDTDIVLNDLQVRVLFSHPMYLQMKPCQFFLNDRCNFADKCRYSHGYVVPFKDLIEYTEPDFESLSIGNICLVQKPSDKECLWSLARVEAIDTANQQVAVRLLDTDDQLAVDRDAVFPITGQLDISDGQSKEATNNIADNEIDHNDDECAPVPASSKIVDKEFGDWEQHTKGIGSKLMAKMGYTMGEGLGKTSDGIMQPIEPVIMPKGKSLDKCIELRQQFGAKDLYAKMREEKRKQEQAEMRKKKKRNPTEAGIFGFINKRLSKGNKREEQLKMIGGNKKSLKRVEKDDTDKDINIKLYELDKEQRTIQRDISKYADIVKRHSGKEEHIAQKANIKLATAQSKMAQLKNQQKKLTREKDRRDNRKSAVF